MSKYQNKKIITLNLYNPPNNNIKIDDIEQSFKEKNRWFILMGLNATTFVDEECLEYINIRRQSLHNIETKRIICDKIWRNKKRNVLKLFCSFINREMCTYGKVSKN